MVPNIPKRLRERQRPFDETIDQILSGNVGIGKPTGRRHPPHLQQIGSSQENGTDHNKENGKISNGGRVLNTVSFQSVSSFVRILHIRSFFRVQTLANVVHATGGEDRTPRRTHIFLSC